jgi:hypothetical protein
MLAASAGPDALESLVASETDLQCDVLQVDAGAVADPEGAAFVEAVRPALVVLTGDSDREMDVGDVRAPVARVAERRGLAVSSDGAQVEVR